MESFASSVIYLFPAFLMDFALTVLLQALDAEYQAMKNAGNVQKTEQCQMLFAWKNKQATQVRYQCEGVMSYRRGQTINVVFYSDCVVGISLVIKENREK